MTKRVMGSNGLILFNSPDDLESFLRGILNGHPKLEKTVQLGRDSFEALDLICDFLVTSKAALPSEKKRDSVNIFLSRRNDQISEKTNELFDQTIRELADLNAKLESMDSEHSMLLKGLATLTHMKSKSDLRNEMMAKFGTQIDSFGEVICRLIDQATKQEKDIKAIKDSIAAIVESKNIKDKAVLTRLSEIASSMTLSLKSVLQITSRSEELKKTIKDYVAVQKSL